MSLKTHLVGLATSMTDSALSLHALDTFIKNIGISQRSRANSFAISACRKMLQEEWEQKYLPFLEQSRFIVDHAVLLHKSSATDSQDCYDLLQIILEKVTAQIKSAKELGKGSKRLQNEVSKRVARFSARTSSVENQESIGSPEVAPLAERVFVRSIIETARPDYAQAIQTLTTSLVETTASFKCLGRFWKDRHEEYLSVLGQYTPENFTLTGGYQMGEGWKKHEQDINACIASVRKLCDAIVIEAIGLNIPQRRKSSFADENEKGSNLQQPMPGGCWSMSFGSEKRWSLLWRNHL